MSERQVQGCDAVALNDTRTREDPVRACDCSARSVPGARYLSEPEVVEAGLALHALIGVVVACEDPRCDDEALIGRGLLAFDPDVEVIEEALQLLAFRLRWHWSGGLG